MTGALHQGRHITCKCQCWQ